jgi:hypothetical protein
VFGLRHGRRAGEKLLDGFAATRGTGDLGCELRVADLVAAERGDRVFVIAMELDRRIFAAGRRVLDGVTGERNLAFLRDDLGAGDEEMTVEGLDRIRAFELVLEPFGILEEGKRRQAGGAQRNRAHVEIGCDRCHLWCAAVGWQGGGEAGFARVDSLQRGGARGQFGAHRRFGGTALIRVIFLRARTQGDCGGHQRKDPKSHRDLRQTNAAGLCRESHRHAKVPSRDLAQL